jgi:hypothetical protein
MGRALFATTGPTDGYRSAIEAILGAPRPGDSVVGAAIVVRSI